MRRTTLLLLCTTILSALTVPAPASAAAPMWPATFRGLTDPQLLPVEFVIEERRAGGLGLRSLELNVDLSCPSGDEFSFGMGMWWGRPVPLDGKVARLDQVEGNLAMHLAVRVTPNRLRGTLTMAMAAFDADERLQRCDSGPQRFTAERVSGSAAPSVSDTADVRLRVTDRGDRVRVVHREPLAREADHRWYSGGFTRRNPIEFSVKGYGTPRAVVDNLAFATELVCDPGETYGKWFFFISWFGGGVDVSDHRGRLDEVWLDYALHWQARVAPGQAHGSLVLAVPAFTPEEELTRCASRATEWTADRVERPQIF